MIFKQQWETADTQYMIPSALIKQMIKTAYPKDSIQQYHILSGGCANLNVKFQLQNDSSPHLLRIYLRDKKAAYREQKLGEIYPINLEMRVL